MGECKVAVLLLWAFFALCTILIEFKVEGKASSPLEKEIEAKLKLLNKPAVKSIKSEDGDIIDCVDIYKQPAFDHPAMKNHTIPKIPDFLLEDSKSSRTIDTFNASSDIFQTWQKSGSCPEGTIPIRRIRKEDLLRAVSLERFGQKPPEPEPFVNPTNTTNLNFPNLNATNDITAAQINRSDAHLAAFAFNFIGGLGNINIWNPKVEQPEDFTTAQIWLKAGNNGDFESVEAGWMVNPKLYGDTNSRLFIAWTKDSYNTTGCFDLTCPGFVQIASEFALGSTVGPYSSEYNQQYELPVAMFWDEDGNWWLRVKDRIMVGYWPAELLGNLKYSASLVQWGGQVYSYNVKKTPHTATQMGSGAEASDLFGFACYISNIRIKDYSKSLKYPDYVNPYAAEPYCYSALNDVHYGKDPVFFFGGPGRSPIYCP